MSFISIAQFFQKVLNGACEKVREQNVLFHVSFFKIHRNKKWTPPIAVRRRQLVSRTFSRAQRAVFTKENIKLVDRAAT